MKKIRAQSSIELLIILSFIFVIIGLVMYVVGLYSLQVQQDSITKERDDFAQSLISEVDLLQKVRGSYTRVIEIPKFITKKYNVSIADPYLILQDFVSEEGEKYYYDLPGNLSQNVFIYQKDTNGDGELETFFYLYKAQDGTLKGLNIDNIVENCNGINKFCAHDFTLLYDSAGTLCPVGYAKIFSITSDNNHVLYYTQSNPSYTTVCLSHKNYDLNMSVGVSSVPLFYLSELIQTHIFTNKTDILVQPAQWYDTILHSSGGVFDYQITQTDLSSTHICLGSINVDNVIGSHYNKTCVSGKEGLWLSLT